MRSAMQGLLVCLAASALVGTSACSSSHTGSEGALDSETHFLASCEGTCPGDLACICGVCTAACERDADCGGLSSEATCQAPGGACSASAPAAVCDASCDEDEDCRSIGPEHRCTAGVCRPEVVESPPPAPVMCGIDEAPALGPTEDVAVATVLSDMRASAVVDYDGGAAFFAADGRLMLLPAGEDEPTAIWQPPAGSDRQQIIALASDGESIFWTAATPPPPSQLLEPQGPMPPSTIERVDLYSSSHAVLVTSDEHVFASLSVDDESLYYTDELEIGLHAVAKIGGEPELRIPQHQGRPARYRDHFYWRTSEALQRGHARTGEVETLLTVEQEPFVYTTSSIHATDSAIVMLIEAPDSETEDQTLARLDPETGCLHIFSLPDGGINAAIMPQGESVFWKGFTNGAFSPGTPRPGARLWRTDLVTGESVQLEPDGLTVTLTVDVLGHDEDNIYVTQGTDLIRISK